MNEMQIATPHSFFMQLIVCFVQHRFNSLNPTIRQKAIEDIKKYWVLFDVETRNFIEDCAKNNILPEFKELGVWIIQNRDKTQQTVKPQQPYIELPVVDVKVR
ncbi:hypothetical protein ACT2CV_01195 [Pasteurellaceae bacterium 22721_9_1]